MAKDSMGESKQSTRKQWVYIMLMVNIVFILLLMTLGIIALRVGNTLPEGVDVLFIVGKNGYCTLNRTTRVTRRKRKA